jgi:hypothetical protein
MVYSRAGEPFGGRLPKLSINFEEILSPAHVNSEEQKKVLSPPQFLFIIPLLLLLLLLLMHIIINA